MSAIGSDHKGDSETILTCKVIRVAICALTRIDALEEDLIVVTDTRPIGEAAAIAVIILFLTMMLYSRWQRSAMP